MKFTFHLMLLVMSAVATALGLFHVLLIDLDIARADIMSNALVGATIVSFLLAMEHCVKDLRSRK